MFALTHLPLAALDQFQRSFTVDHPIQAVEEGKAKVAPASPAQFVVDLDMNQPT